jgi:predicted DCC family thiol-disulfide oxidoreductase YuxK
MVVLYDEACEFCRATASWIRRVDRGGAIDCVPLQSAADAIGSGLERARLLEELHVLTPAGEVRRGWDAVVAIMRALPPLAPLAAMDRLPLVNRIGHRAYRWVTANRGRLVVPRPGRVGGACGANAAR